MTSPTNRDRAEFARVALNAYPAGEPGETRADDDQVIVTVPGHGAI